jgi:hypothetical protein
MRFLVIIPLLFISACSGGDHIDYLRMRDIPAPTIESFTHCYNYGCAKRETLALPVDTKSKIDRIFATESKSPKAEQSRIIEALQMFEQDIGNITGTKNDKRGTFRAYQNNSPESKSFQQDCIDESTNTTTYLSLLNQMGYLKFYSPAFPANRQPFTSKAPWWHQTAVMRDNKTGALYAVDTWFEDNGVKGYIVPLREWKDGWKPERD